MSAVPFRLMAPLAAATAMLLVGYGLVATDPGRQVLPSAAAPAEPGLAKTHPASQPASQPWVRPRFAQRQDDRDRMVADQIESRGVRDKHVVAAMQAVPRHEFVPERSQRTAYADCPLPVGYGQTISQPYIVALMTALVQVKPSAKILEIGTGSGYQAAVLTELTPHVYSIEIVRPLFQAASKTLNRLGYTAVTLKQGDGYYGWPEHGPFDAIIVTCAAGHLPPPLFTQLKPDGRIVIPIGLPGAYQELQVVTKDAKTGLPRFESVLPVRFVPMTGRIQSGSRQD